jgi:hypothetical protein
LRKPGKLVPQGIPGSNPGLGVIAGFPCSLSIPGFATSEQRVCKSGLVIFLHIRILLRLTAIPSAMAYVHFFEKRRDEEIAPIEIASTNPLDIIIPQGAYGFRFSTSLESNTLENERYFISTPDTRRKSIFDVREENFNGYLIIKDTVDDWSRIFSNEFSRHVVADPWTNFVDIDQDRRVTKVVKFDDYEFPNRQTW